MHTVCTVAPADHDHGITNTRQRCGLFLPRRCCKAYCIINFCICTSFFYDIQAFVKIIFRLRGLNDDCNRPIPQFRVVFDPCFRLFRSFKYRAFGTARTDGVHFRMLFHADDNDKAPFPAGLFHNTVNMHDLWAGSILYNRSFCLKRCKGFGRNAVGADQHALLRLYFLNAFHGPQSAFRETPDFILVVDQHSEACTGPILKHGFRHFHRPADAEAESGAFRNAQLFHASFVSPSGKG